MRLKKVGEIQKRSGIEKAPNEENHINSKENVEKVEDTKEKIEKISPVTQIDYDDLPEGVYDFSGLSELQHRKTRPNLRENEKLLRSRIKKDKKPKHQENKKNIVEEIFEAKNGTVGKNEEKQIKDAKLDLKDDLKEQFIKLNEKDEEKLKENADETLLKKDFEDKTDENLKEELNKTLDESVEEKKAEEINNTIMQKEIVHIEEPKEEVIEKVEKEIKNDEEEKNEEYEEYEEYENYDEEEYDEYSLTDYILDFFTPNKQIAFFSMLILGIITQISFLATNRSNNLIGLLDIILSAISMLLVINVLGIKNKITIFIISLIAVLIPYYNDKLVTGENSLIYSASIALAIFSLNLIFVKKNKIISFIFSLVIFIISTKMFSNSIAIFLVVSILKIIKDMFNKKEKTINFILHCAMICIILAVGIII